MQLLRRSLLVLIALIGVLVSGLWVIGHFNLIMVSKHDKPTWERNWPHHDHSRFVRAGGLKWHVQEFGAPAAGADAKPQIVLIHGTGASTHSWRDVVPLLWDDYHVIAMDLPGHAFSDTPAISGLSLPGMSKSLAALLGEIDVRPEVVVGHSAGAAIAIRMAIDGFVVPRVIVSLNGALKPFPGMAGHVFPTIAKALFVNPVTPWVFAWSASKHANVDRLLRDTGSKLSAEGTNLYARLFRSTGHVAGTLGMMANWDLNPLVADMGRLPCDLVLVASLKDKTIDVSVANQSAKLSDRATVERVPGLGHLAHEENPATIVRIIQLAVKRAKMEAGP
ncbi:MAG: alpha/beta fold hydrolase BchO [Pseudomonadota bacterium]